MAKRRKSSVRTVRRSGGGGRSSPAAIIVNTPSAPARRSGGGRRRVHAIAHRVRHGVRRVGGSVGTALLSAERTGAMLGAGLLGLLDKQGTSIPTVPFLGRAGTSGLVLWWLSKHQKSPQLNHAATGCLSIAVYELMRDGKIAGAEDGTTVFTP